MLTSPYSASLKLLPKEEKKGTVKEQNIYLIIYTYQIIYSNSIMKNMLEVKHIFSSILEKAFMIFWSSDFRKRNLVTIEF